MLPSSSPNCKHALRLHSAQPYAPRLKCEVVRGHQNGTVVSARYAFLLMDLFFPMSQQVCRPAVQDERCGTAGPAADAERSLTGWLTAELVQESKVLVHTPDCASLHKIRPVPWRQKSINATLIGNSWEVLYPLRHTMQQAIDAGMIHGGELLPHPGCAAHT